MYHSLPNHSPISENLHHFQVFPLQAYLNLSGDLSNIFEQMHLILTLLYWHVRELSSLSSSILKNFEEGRRNSCKRPQHPLVFLVFLVLIIPFSVKGAVEDHTNGIRHTYLTQRRLPLGKNNDFADFLQTIDYDFYSGRYILQLNLPFKAKGL